ncbi:uncharacterized protein LOC112452337 [Temnothorax curvispinosus]|uniref:Uncharacterized protein LOC112452337 n=2 Tax=Temnothorax TaxID=300110 RepID=A0A6J1PG56_9HYME|nr:uncharacterized protein LOC112452337 [Temnothorax curvispinosus]
MSTEDNEKNPSTSHPGPNVEDPKLQEYYTDEKIESLLVENLYLKSLLKMSTKDNQKNPSTSHPGPNVEDPKLQEYYTDEEIESLLIENLYLKSQLKRLHPKMSTDDN